MDKRPEERDDHVELAANRNDGPQPSPSRVHYPQQLPVPLSPNPRSDKSSPQQTPSVATPATADDDYDDMDDDQYDWSGEEDLLDEERRYAHQMTGQSTEKKGWGPRRILVWLLSTLVGSTILTGLLAAAPILLKKFWVDRHYSEHRQHIWEQIAAWVFWAAANIMLSWYFAFFVDIVPIITSFLVELVWGDLSEYVKSRIELYNSAKHTIKPILYGATGLASWVIIFHNIYGLYDPSNEGASRVKYTPRVYQTVKFLFFVMLVLSIEKAIKHMIAFAFHKRAFQDRMTELTKTLTTLDHLREYRPRRRGFRPQSSQLNLKQGLKTAADILSAGTPALPEALKERPFWRRAFSAGSHNTEREEEETPHTSNSVSGEKGDAKYTSRRNSLDSTRPPTPKQEKQEEHESTAARILRSTILHDARNIKGKDGYANTALNWDVTSSHEAKQIARTLYHAFRADRKRKYLVPSDFYPAYATHEAAEEAFRIFDKDGNGDISRAEIKTTVVKVYRERRFLVHSLRDVEAALRTLDKLMIVAALIILFFIGLAVFRVEFGASLTSVYSIALAASFIFRNAASSAFDSIIFLFVTHPFDTGDRVFIDAENLVVKKTGLFATVFQRVDGTTSYYFNSQLFGKFITNVRRSGKQGEVIKLQVSWRTPISKINELEKCMNEWLQTEEKRWFQPSTSCNVQRIEFQNSLDVVLGIGYNSNWQDWGLYMARKTAFHTAVRFYCRKLGIVCAKPPQPIVFTKDPHEMHPESKDFVDPDSNVSDKLRAMHGVEVKPMLGFMPPPTTREELAQIRARKAKKGKRYVTEAAGGD